MICKKCGKLTGDNNICPYCGEKSIINNDAQKNISKDERKNTFKNFVGWIVFFVIVIPCLFFSWIIATALIPIGVGGWVIYFHIDQYINSNKSESETKKLIIIIMSTIICVILTYIIWFKIPHNSD